MLGDFPWNAWHVRGFPHEDVSVSMEEVAERAFLFGGKRGADAHHFVLKAARVYEDLLDALRGLKIYGRLLGVGCFLGDPLLDTVSSLEAIIAEACSQHSTSHS